MPEPTPFQHLSLVQRYKGDARLSGGGAPDPTTDENRRNYESHASRLRGNANFLSDVWTRRRESQEGRVIIQGIPILLQIDPNLDLDELRRKLGFEIISEQEDGYVIVASEDLELSKLQDMISLFSSNSRGSAVMAKVHDIVDDIYQAERLKRLLSEHLYSSWSDIQDDQNYICDVGVGGLGIQEVPKFPNRGTRDTDETWLQKQIAWERARDEVYQHWDALKIERESQIEGIVDSYGGQIINMIDGVQVNAAYLPDSFTVRLELQGIGLKDLILNYPYIFEVTEPEDIDLPQRTNQTEITDENIAVILPPADNAPAVCVIDSGIQEAHTLLAPAVDGVSSFCFLPDEDSDSVADFVSPGGHGTRVAGAILYGESIPRDGEYAASCWIQNARILDSNNKMPINLPPHMAIRSVIEKFNNGPKKTRVFNHSINSSAPCRLKHMSAWAAEIDLLSDQRDIIVVQSAGNISQSSTGPNLGISEYLQNGNDYPHYLVEDSCRVANPAQSLQALTVGSIAYNSLSEGGWSSLAPDLGHPSAFSRTGFGIWGVIKPEVVEYGGDFLRTNNTPPDISTPSHTQLCYPELVRSTMFPPGLATGRDAIGTSFSAPKVTHIVAQLAELLPEDNCLIYRALVVQSARWPEWALNSPSNTQADILRKIGYGLPSKDRATTNTDYRTTLIVSKDLDNTNEELRIKAGEAHIYQVPIPENMRRPGDEYDVLIEVTLSYSAKPRRTRRNLRNYLSTWVDWKSSKLGESLDSFRIRSLKNQEEGINNGNAIPWMLENNPNWGQIRGVKRSVGTVQKDWAVVSSNQLPEDFCISVVGHKGWSNDPHSSAKYALTVSFEMLGQEIPIYENIKVSVQELQQEIEMENEISIS